MTAVFGPRAYLIPIVTMIGGLIAGLLVYKLAPEAEGVGTQAIKAFHKGDAIIKPHVPLVKLLASALTIGSGGHQVEKDRSRRSARDCLCPRCLP